MKYNLHYATVFLWLWSEVCSAKMLMIVWWVLNVLFLQCQEITELWLERVWFQHRKLQPVLDQTKTSSTKPQNIKMCSLSVRSSVSSFWLLSMLSPYLAMCEEFDSQLILHFLSSFSCFVSKQAKICSQFRCWHSYLDLIKVPSN